MQQSLVGNRLQGIVINGVLEAGLEPAQPQWSRDFKSLVSTIPPFEQPVFILLQGKQKLLFRCNLAKVSSFAINSKEICNNL